MSCKICNSLQSPSKEAGVYFFGKFTADVIRKSAERGCEGCQILLKADHAQDGLGKFASFEYMEIFLGDRVQLKVAHDGGYQEYRFPFASKPTPWSSLPVYAVLPPAAPTMASSMPHIRAWLEQCTSAHRECAAQAETPLPTRVIDIGSPRDVPKLRISQPGEQGNYCALSHSWGPKDPRVPRVITTRDNLDKHIRGLPSLPRTFAQAVEVTRALGFRYLWIDSLCIIQEDKEDWDSEASRMAAVYSNATLVIAASWSPNGAGGLFPSRPSSLPIPSPKPHTFLQKDARGVTHPILSYSNALIDHPTLTIHPCHQSHNANVLATRAWCLQERALARRILHFGDVEILFECRHSDRPVCVCGSSTHPAGGQAVGPHRFDRWVAEYQGGRQQGGSVAMARDKGERESSSVEVVKRWKEMVEEYTQREITNVGDRLPAIGGLVERLSGGTGLTYLKGMWREHVGEQLGWYSTKGTVASESNVDGLVIFSLPAGNRPQVSERLEVGYAPSWSWASVATSVKFLPSPVDVEVFDVVDEPTTLTLQARVIPVTRIDATSVVTPVDGLLGHNCRVSWDAGVGAKEWDKGAEFEHAVLVIHWEYWNFYGLVMRRARNTLAWGRIGLVEKVHDALGWKEAGVKEKQQAWMRRSPKVTLVLE